MKGTKKVSIVLVVSILLSVCTGISTAYAKQSDASDWAVPYYEKAKEYKILPNSVEKQDGTENITREVMVELVIELYEATQDKNVKATHPDPFTDTKNMDVLKAYALGMVKGVDETTFDPKGIIDREQLCLGYYKLFKLINPDYSCNLDTVEKFADDDQISPWAREAVYSLRDLRLISGFEDNTFKPQENVSLESGVAFSVRFYELFGDIC
jgi:hypothetical protein